MEIESDLADKNRELQNQILMLNFRFLGNYLLFRGVPESQGKFEGK